MTSVLKMSVGLFLAGAALAVTPKPAAAATSSFDGNWSVLIVTNSGPCDQFYRFGLFIRNGDIFYNGSTPVTLNGRVKSNGSVRVHVSSGAQKANGIGRLSLDYGRGEWRGAGSSGTCVGWWTAERYWTGAYY